MCGFCQLLELQWWRVCYQRGLPRLVSEILHLDWHLNRCIGSKVTAILLNVWILPIAGASAVKGLRLQPAQQACLKQIFMVEIDQLFCVSRIIHDLAVGCS